MDNLTELGHQIVTLLLFTFCFVINVLLCSLIQLHDKKGGKNPKFATVSFIPISD